MDALRGIAALWVLFFHLNETIAHRNDVYSEICRLGYLGVPAFFVISGWCMQTIQCTANHPGRFLFARVTRIYPPYLASLAITLLILLSNKVIRGVNDLHVSLPNDFLGLFSIAIMMPKPATHYHGLNWSYWTLPIELSFYITVAAGIWISRLSSKNFKRIYLVDSLLIISLVTGVINGTTEATLFYWMPYYKYFALGIYANNLSRNWQARFGAKFQAATRVMLTVIAIAATEGDHKATLAAIITFAVMTIEQNAHQEIKTGMIAAASVFLGSVSYSIYLLHVPIGCWVFGRFRADAVLDNQGLHILVDSAIAILVVGLSHFFYSRVERRFHGISRKIASA